MDRRPQGVAPTRHPSTSLRVTLRHSKGHFPLVTGPMKLVIASRGSQLARWQAEWVRQRLLSAGYEVEIKIIRTTGDKLASVSLTEAGTKGLFIKEIEEALLAKAADVAVHSLKDLPTEQPDRLIVVAVPEREDPRDVLISRTSKSLAELPAGARVATSSLRRASQLRGLRRDLQIIPVRGNIDTRLRKLDQGEFDAIVLAAAGLRRLKLENRITHYFPIQEMCPAVGQGAMAIEIREGDASTKAAVRPLDDTKTHLEVRAERATLRRLGGGCQVPIAAHAQANGSELKLLGVVVSLDGTKAFRAELCGSAGDPEDLGARVADELLRKGARAAL